MVVVVVVGGGWVGGWVGDVSVRLVVVVNLTVHAPI